jgi:peptidoglycan/LPS O-acetylase OafA/YrhL
VQSKSINYIPALDHLRFLAASLVVLFHTFMAGQNSGRPADPFSVPFIDQGHTGVALFMVISGFIMTMMFTGRELEPIKFYANRFLRIYPLMILVVTAGYFSTPDPRPASVGVDYLMSLLPISNLYRLDYGAFGGHLWTIAVELQFYLLLPLLLKFRRRYGSTAFYAGTLGLALALRVAQYMVKHTAHTFTYFTMFGSIDLFVGGMITAELYIVMQERKLRFSLWWSAFALIAIGTMIASIFSVPSFFQIDFHNVTADHVSHSNKWIFWPLLQAVMWGSFLLLYLRSRGEIPGATIVTSFGKWSYSIYIWHILIIEILKNRFLWMTPYALSLFVILPITLVVSFASYSLIEVPFLSLRSAYSKIGAEPAATLKMKRAK